MLVSVIVPVYNVEEYLSECLNSIINQTYSNLEIIIINDGSTDGSLRIIEEFKSIDNRILLINQENSGQSTARNNGLNIANGEFISFVDSDDKVAIDFIEKCIDQFDEDIDVVQCSYNEFKEDNKKRMKILSDEVISEKYALSESYLKSNKMYPVVWNKVYRNSSIKSLTFKKGVIYEDMHFLIDLSLNINKMKNISNDLYFYRIRENSTVTAEFSDKNYDLLEVIEKHKVISLNIPKLYNFVVQRNRLIYINLFKKAYNSGSQTDMKKIMRKYRSFNSNKENKCKKGLQYNKKWALMNIVFSLSSVTCVKILNKLGK